MQIAFRLSLKLTIAFRLSLQLTIAFRLSLANFENVLWLSLELYCILVTLWLPAHGWKLKNVAVLPVTHTDFDLFLFQSRVL